LLHNAKRQQKAKTSYRFLGKEFGSYFEPLCEAFGNPNVKIDRRRFKFSGNTGL